MPSLHSQQRERQTRWGDTHTNIQHVRKRQVPRKKTKQGWEEEGMTRGMEYTTLYIDRALKGHYSERMTFEKRSETITEEIMF